MTLRDRPSGAPIRTDSPYRVAAVICFTAIFSYSTARLAGFLVIRPEMIWPLWPGCAFVLALLLLTSRKIWPAILLAGLAGFAVYDMQERLSIRTTVLLLGGDSIEIVVAALGVSYVFGGAPRLNSVKSLAKYSLFAIILAPISVASTTASALQGDSWWIGFFTEALALFTVTPAVLGWADIALARATKPKTRYIEGLVLFIGLVTLAHYAFVASDAEIRPALLYALVPFLLWAAFRFGVTGVSSSIVVVSFLAILSAVHGRGPFTGNTPEHNVLSLQLFLLVAGSSFMALAALVEQYQTAEDSIRQREKLLRIFVKNVPAGVAMLDREMKYVQVSDRWCADYGVDASQVLGRSHYELFPDIPERWREIHRRALDGETLRADADRWDRVNSTTWVRWEILPWTTGNGTIGGILIFAEDITRRRQMEEAVADVSRKLIQSQEQERSRIGRELHDDINQRLAMLAVELQRLQDPSEFQQQLQVIQQQIGELSSDVQALSHELHSSKLEYLGVVAGLRSWCKEFGEHHRINISLTTDVVSPIPSDLGVTLLRVLQEALHNAVKHSGANSINVQLLEVSNKIQLTITDAGKGFDVAAAKRSRGLGLTSMEERVRLANGTIAIESQPSLGSTITVGVPLKPDQASQRAAG